MKSDWNVAAGNATHTAALATEGISMAVMAEALGRDVNTGNGQGGPVPAAAQQDQRRVCNDSYVQGELYSTEMACR